MTDHPQITGDLNPERIVKCSGCSLTDKAGEMMPRIAKDGKNFIYLCKACNKRSC